MKEIFAVFDRKTSSCVFVKEAANLKDFERWFATAFLRSDSLFALYPFDYDIYNLCGLDDEHMKLITDYPPVLMCSVSELFDIFKIPSKIPSPTVAQSGE